MVDKREYILNSEFEKYKSEHPADNWASIDDIKKDGTAQIVFNAMDENGKQMAIDFLKYTLEKMHGHSVDGAGNVEIKYNGEWLTPEQLFENFL